MEVEQYKAGDEVQLKSGGPMMMVEDVEGDMISCVWFNGKIGAQKAERSVFVAATLKRASRGVGMA